MNEATPFKLLFKIFFRTKNEFHVCSIFVAFWILCFNEKVFLLLSETLLKAEEAMETTTTASTLNSSSVVSPKGRKMSFREKFKRFTSPTQNRKEINSGETESSSEGGRGDTPPRELKSQNYHKNASSSKTEGMTLRERIACALSPESLRKRDNHNQNESSPKKKKSSFSPGTSPNNTSQLIKRSKISQEIDQQEMTEAEVTKEASVEAAEVAGNGKTLVMPLSPSINFIDASMTESFESATIIKNRNSSEFEDLSKNFNS